MSFWCHRFDQIEINWPLGIQNCSFLYQPLCSCNFVISNLKIKSWMDSKVEAPSTGTFLVNCTSDQNGYYSTTANLTLSVTEGGGGNGTAVKEIISQKKKYCKKITQKSDSHATPCFVHTFFINWSSMISILIELFNNLSKNSYLKTMNTVFP